MLDYRPTPRFSIETESVLSEDDKHAKHRHGGGSCRSTTTTTVATRICLLTGLPLAYFLWRAVSLLHSLSSSSEASDVIAIDGKEVVAASAVSTGGLNLPTYLFYWITLSMFGVVGERLRLKTVRKRSKAQAGGGFPPFILLLLAVYALQLICYFVTSYGGVSRDSVSHFVESGIEGSKKRMRGLGLKFPRQVDLPVTWDAETAEGSENDRVGRFSVKKWSEHHSTEYIDDSVLAHMSSSELVAVHQRHRKDGVLSIVLASHNEHEYTTRTLESLLNSTRPGLLHEILIIDDASDPPMTQSYNTTLFAPPLVKVLRNEERQGLIRSKLTGGDMAEGSVIVFLDAHVKPDPQWAIPIVRNINENYKRVVVPRIPVLNGTTWVVNRAAIGEKMMFDWDLMFRWFHDGEPWVPCMSGGLLAMSKRWWTESGKLDDGMFVWGGENIEQSVRIWLCGGEIVVAHDSLIAHVFRPRFPYSVDSSKVLYNKLRLVETWFDDYREQFYRATPGASRYRPIHPIPYIGHGKDVDATVDQTGPFVNISKRLELRESLNCKPFETYIQRFEHVFTDRNMIPVKTFLIRNPASDSCLAPASTGGIQHLVFVSCNEIDPKQRWHLTYNNTAIANIKVRLCLDAAMTKWPQEWQPRWHGLNPRYKQSADLTHPFELYGCQASNFNQMAWRFQNDRLVFGSYCAAVGKEDTSMEREALLSVCRSIPDDLNDNMPEAAAALTQSEDLDTQRHSGANGNSKQIGWHMPPAEQRFEKAFQETLSIEKLRELRPSST